MEKSIKRTGRLNETRLIDGKFEKISTIKELKRPRRLKVEQWAMEQARIRGANVPLAIEYTHETEKERLVSCVIFGRNLHYYNSEIKKAAFHETGRQLKKLRGGFQGYGWIDYESYRGLFKDWQSFLFFLLEEYGGRDCANNFINNQDLHFLKQIIDRDDLCVSVPSLVHRDIKQGNVLRDLNGKIWIVDWENAILGDSLFDLAQVSANYGRGDLWQAMLNGYGQPDVGKKYLLYEIIILITVIDFCHKYGDGIQKRIKSLSSKIKNLKKY